MLKDWKPRLVSAAQATSQRMRSTMTYILAEARQSEVGAKFLSSAAEQQRDQLIRQKQRELRDLYNVHLRAQEAEFKHPVNLRVSVATWNVAMVPPPEIGLFTDRLQKLFHLPSDPDVLAICLQEVSMTVQNVMLSGVGELGPGGANRTLTEEARAWAEYLDRELSQLRPNCYTQVAKGNLVGLLLVVYVKKAHLSDLGHVAVDISRTGSSMGVVGNKGGIGCRFSLYGKRFLFIGVHFPAHAEFVDRRNAVYHEMLASMRFRLPVQCDDLVDQGSFASFDGAPPRCPVDFTASEPHHRWQKRRSFRIPEHDYIFWFGDLNYHLDKIGNETVRKYLALQTGPEGAGLPPSAVVSLPDGSEAASKPPQPTLSDPLLTASTPAPLPLSDLSALTLPPVTSASVSAPTLPTAEPGNPVGDPPPRTCSSAEQLNLSCMSA
eukprot:RCo047816